MNNQKSDSGRQVNWLNYPTGLKELYIRLEVDNSSAQFSIDIQNKDQGVRELIWEQFIELKKVLENEMGEDAVWSKVEYNLAGQEISKVSWKIDNVSMYRETDKTPIFNFFKSKLIAFDKFYSEFKDVLFGLLK